MTKDKLMNNATDSIQTNYGHFSTPTQTTIAAIILFGFMGNLGCVIACRVCLILKRCRFSSYLIACCLSDTVFLICLGLIWLKRAGINWHDLSAVCTTSTFFTNTSTFLSAWYVTAITFELASTLRYPYRVYKMVTKRHALLKRVLIILVGGILLNTWTLAMARSVQIQMGDRDQQNTHIPNSTKDSTEIFVCQIKADKEAIYRAFTAYDIVLSVAAPLTVTLASIVVIIGHILRYRLRLPISLVRDRNQDQYDREISIADHSNLDGPMIDLWPISQNGTNPQAEFQQENNRIDTDRVLIIATPAAAFGEKRLNTISKRRQQSLMSPAKYHAMLHRQHFQMCMRLEGKVRPLLILKTGVYVILTLPHFIHRIWFMLDEDADAGEHGHIIQLVIYFLFYTQFALNGPLYATYACIYRLIGKYGK